MGDKSKSIYCLKKQTQLFEKKIKTFFYTLSEIMESPYPIEKHVIGSNYLLCFSENLTGQFNFR